MTLRMLTTMSILFLAGCQTTSGVESLFNSKLIEDQSSAVQAVVTTAGVLPKSIEATAHAHCSKHGKSAVYTGTKSGYPCLNKPCNVYYCVKP